MRELLQNTNAVVSAIVGIFGGLALLFPQVRRWAAKLFSIVRVMFTAPFEVYRVSDNVKGLGATVEEMKRDLSYNGNNSTKDMVALLVNARKHDMRGIPRPILELDGNGNALFANDAAFRLFRAVDFENLRNGSWFRFLDSDDVADFVDAYKSSAAKSDYFRFGIRVIARGENRGMWEFNASPIDSGKGTGRVYSVDISPLDKEARDIAARAGWIGCPRCQSMVSD